MRSVGKVLFNKWVLLQALVIASYIYAAAYESAVMTPIDEMSGIMQAVAEDEAFAEAYGDMDWGMSLEEYRESAGNVTLLKSRFLQGPLTFLTSMLTLTIAIVIVQLGARLGERIRRRPEKTRLMETIDITMPALLAETLKYLVFSMYAMVSGTLPDYNIALSAAVTVAACTAPYIINCLHRRRSRKPYGAVAVGGTIASAAALAFQLL